ncbi:RTA1 like protein-domain-containing protein, partial [Dioszegia hungarica]
FKTHPRAKYMRPVRWGATIMAFGYLCRFSRRTGINAWSWLFETFQFLLLSPCAFLAQVYVLLPHLAEALEAEDCLPIGGRALKWIFISADIITVLAQLAGTALTITFGDLVEIGKWVVTGGLWVQLVFFLTFMVIFSIFASRLRKRHLDQGGIGADVGGHKWIDRCTSLIYVMFEACLCLFVRSIYRVAEYTSGAKSALGLSETAFYILDALMMLLLIIGFCVVWAPRCLEGKILPSAVDRWSRPGGTVEMDKVRRQPGTNNA